MAVFDLPSAGALAAFVAASVVLAVTPGPGVIYIVSRTLAQGRKAGIGSVAGVACGNLLNAIGASLGLAALFALSSVAFTVVKLAGAAYLVWLGIGMLRKPAAEAGVMGTVGVLAPVPVAKLFRDGLLVALLNPKTAIFFAAFLPQFMRGDGAASQAIALGALFVVIAACTDLLYALLAATLARRVAGAGWLQRAGRRASGLALIGLGVASAFAQRPAVR